jgi:hypothetical protein
MKGRSFLTDERGANLLLEYIFTFTFASVLFVVMLMMTSGLFIQGPARTVSKVQYTDIGNDLTAKIIDTYLIAPISPSQGNVTTVFEIPNTVAGDGYMVNVIDKGDDKEVVVHSLNNNIAMKVTLNGVSKTIPVSGETWSQFPVHQIRYDSNQSNNP